MDAALGVILAAAATGGVEWTPIMVGLLSGAAVVGAAVVTSRVAGRANRDSALLKWAEQLQASEQDARKEAQASRERAERIRDEADGDVERLRGQLDAIQVQLDMAQQAAARVTDTLISVATEVWRPEPDIPALRRLVGRPTPPGVNGRTV